MVRWNTLYPRDSIGRLGALDGLRGIAATVVMIYHTSLVARPFLDTGTVGDAWWWITETPLKVFTAGTEAVLVFFVLSGLVVALPTLVEGFSWTRFLTTRFLRLYLPVWGALVFAELLIVFLPRDASRVSSGEWVDTGNAQSFSLGQFLAEASLWQRSYNVDNVLWSLRWELIFTVLLPLFVLLALAVRRWWVAAASIAIVLTIAGRVVDTDALVYLPVFFLGTLMAVRLPQILAAAARRSSGFWWAATIGSLALIILSWVARPLVAAGSQLSGFLWGFAGIGAAGLILAALGFPAVIRALTSRVPQWLGKVSFSLYLVHVPVIATVAFLVRDSRWWLVALIAVPVSLVLAQVFFSAVERPSHRLARAMGTTVAARLSAAREPTAVSPQGR